MALLLVEHSSGSGVGQLIEKCLSYALCAPEVSGEAALRIESH